jgi:peptidyl-prolyl cis-trans isomerase SurA
MNHTRRLAWLALTLGVVAAVPVARAEIIEQILVKVNGEIFTKTDLEARQVAILRQRSQQLSDADLKKAIADITPQLLVDTVDEMLMYQRGKELGYKLTEDMFTRILDNIKKENKIETDAQLEAALKSEGMTMADLRKQMERNAIINEVQRNEVVGRISITETEARNYYDRHASEFTTPSAITVREILVTVPSTSKGINVALEEEAKAKADRIRARVLAGESFDTLAAEASDSGSKANGGLIGPVNENELDPTLQKILAPMKVGDVSEVIRMSRGYLILKLESKTEKNVLPYEQVREQIGNKVGDEKTRGEMEKYLAKLRAEAVIEWKNPELKKLYDKKLAELASTPGAE